MCGQKSCADMCVDMHVGMCVHMSTDMRTDMRIGMRVGMCRVPRGRCRRDGHFDKAITT